LESGGGSGGYIQLPPFSSFVVVFQKEYWQIFFIKDLFLIFR
jgi:hypothetical protein